MSGSYSAAPGELRQLMTVTNCDEDQARFLLEAAQGNLDLALGMFYEIGTPSQAPAPMAPQPYQAAQPSSVRSPPRLRAPQASQPSTSQSAGAPAPNRNVHALVRLSARALKMTFGVLKSVLSAGAGMVSLITHRVVPAPLMRMIRAVTRSHDLDTTDQARSFIAIFKSLYGDRHPRWVESGIRNATTRAKDEHRFLFVYLHSPEHQDTSTFCQSVLCSPLLVDYVNTQFVCWGGDVSYSDPYVLASRLSVTTFPFAAVLNVAPNNRVSLVASAPGVTTADKLLAVLMSAVEEQGALLVVQRAELQERDFTRRLLAEQNDEYEVSLAADREREVRVQEERRKAEEDRLEREAAEESARLEAEAQERRAAADAEACARHEAELAASIQMRRDARRATLPQEPSADDAAGVALVRVRLPDGSSCSRRFLGSHTLGHVFDLVYSLDSTNYERFTLVSNYPRQVFSLPDGVNTTLSEAGFVPHGNLFVQPLED